MKKQLEEKLTKIDRKFKWFWMYYVRPKIGVSYQHYMEMLNGNTPMRDDVKKAIKAYLES